VAQQVIIIVIIMSRQFLRCLMNDPIAMVGVDSGSLYRQTHSRSHLAWSNQNITSHVHSMAWQVNMVHAAMRM